MPFGPHPSINGPIIHFPYWNNRSYICCGRTGETNIGSVVRSGCLDDLNLKKQVVCPRLPMLHFWLWLKGKSEACEEKQSFVVESLPGRGPSLDS